MADFLNVDSNINEVLAGLNNVAVKQVPFAIAKSLTKTAQAAQEYVISQIPGIFNNQKTWYLKQQPTGIKITPATKTNLVASVYTTAHFAGLQEEGGVKTPYRGKVLLIPTSYAPKYARKAGGQARVLEGKKTLNVYGSYFVKMKSGHVGVFQRVGKKRLPIRKIYSVYPKANIKKRFGFYSIVQSVVDSKMGEIFSQAIDDALKTAR